LTHTIAKKKLKVAPIRRRLKKKKTKGGPHPAPSLSCGGQHGDGYEGRRYEGCRGRQQRHGNLLYESFILGEIFLRARPEINKVPGRPGIHPRPPPPPSIPGSGF